MLALPACCGSLVAISYLVTAHATTILSKVRVFSLLISSDLNYFVYAFVVLICCSSLQLGVINGLCTCMNGAAASQMSATAEVPRRRFK